MYEYVQIADIAFEQRFRPLLNSDGAWRDFDWTDSANREEIARATQARRIWTTLDVDGFVMVSSGWHFVNRLGYVITEVEVPLNTDVDVYDPEELEDWNERLRIAELTGSDSP